MAGEKAGFEGDWGRRRREIEMTGSICYLWKKNIFCQYFKFLGLTEILKGKSLLAVNKVGSQTGLGSSSLRCRYTFANFPGFTKNIYITHTHTHAKQRARKVISFLKRVYLKIMLV